MQEDQHFMDAINKLAGLKAFLMSERVIKSEPESSRIGDE